MTGLMMIPSDAVALGIGAFLGAFSRYQCGRITAEWIASDPHRLGKFSGWHTSAINVGGSFLLGGIAASPVVTSDPSYEKKMTAFSGDAKRRIMQFKGLSPRTKLMMGVGFCGSFTTFSTYSVDVATWISEGKATKALKYVAVNNVGGIAAAAAGMVLMKKFVG